MQRDWVFLFVKPPSTPTIKLKLKIIAKKALHNNQQTNLSNSFSFIRNFINLRYDNKETH